MTRLITPTAVLAFLLCSVDTAAARSPQVPSIQGRYDTNSSEICTITQNGGSILISAREVGLRHFLFQGEYGIRTSGNELCQIQQDGFHGQYRIIFDDNRPSIEGFASVFPTPRTGEWNVEFYENRNGQLVAFDLKTIRRIGALHDVRPVTQPVVRPTYTASRPTPSDRLDVSNRDFNLLPAEDLADLGL